MSRETVMGPELDAEIGAVIEDVSLPLCRGAFFIPLIARNLRIRLA